MVVVNTLKKSSVSEYLKQYKGSTFASYRSCLRNFFGVIYPDLKRILEKDKIKPEDYIKYDKLMDELSLEYVQNLENDFPDDMIQLKDWLEEENKSPKTKNMYFSVVFAYLEANGLEFTKQYKNNMLGKAKKAEAISEEKVPSPDELKRIMPHLPLPARAYAYILAMGGPRPGEGLNLRLDDLILDYVAKFRDDKGNMKEVPIPKINIRHKSAKTGIKRHTYITQEAKQEVEIYLDYRDEYIERLASSYYTGGRGKAMLERMKEENIVFPFSKDAISGMWETALKKAGLFAKDPNTNRTTLRLHNLRKFFETWGNWSNPAVPECLAGHIQGMRKIYQRMDQAEKILVEAYKEAEPNLTLFGSVQVEVDSEEVKEIENRLTQARLEILEAKEERRELRDDNKLLKAQIAELYEKLGSLEGLKDRIEELEDYVEIGVLRKMSDEIEEKIE